MTMPIWGPGRRFSENIDVSRTWLPLLNFEGREIKMQPGSNLLNFVESTICSMLKLSNCLLQYITSEKQWTEAWMLHWFEIIGSCILKETLRSGGRNDFFPDNLHEPLQWIGHSYIGRRSRRDGRTPVQHDWEIWRVLDFLCFPNLDKTCDDFPYC